MLLYREVASSAHPPVCRCVVNTCTGRPFTLISARRPARADVQQSAYGNIIESVLVIGYVEKIPTPWDQVEAHALPFQLPVAQCVANAPYQVSPVCFCSSSM